VQTSGTVYGTNGIVYGTSRGINRGIIAAHRRGILTSTSLVVNTPWSEAAALLGRAALDLSVIYMVSSCATQRSHPPAPSATTCVTQVRLCLYYGKF
jgi:YdjC-like protein